MALNLSLLLLFWMQLGLVAAASVQKVITNHCNGQDCEINIQYHDAERDLSLQTSSNDSVISALLDIIIPRDGSSDQNDLVSLMENVIVMLSSMMKNQQINHEQLDDMFQKLEPEITTNLEAETTRQPTITTTQAPMQDCYNAPSTGQYMISPPNSLNPFLVVCDMDTTSERWIVIQRRFDGSVDFDRNWADYENGFGSLDGEFWLGLNKMHTITSHGTWKLRFDLEDFDGNHVYAEYGFFRVGDSASNYQLTIQSFSGSVGDAMIKHHGLNGMQFTTKDRDNDETSARHCGIAYKSGWWHKNCAESNVNGLYLGQGVHRDQGMCWFQWKSNWEVLKKTEMKVKRVD